MHYVRQERAQRWGVDGWVPRNLFFFFFHKGKMCQQNSKLVHTLRREPAASNFGLLAQETFRLRRLLITSSNQMTSPDPRDRKGKKRERRRQSRHQGGFCAAGLCMTRAGTPADLQTQPGVRTKSAWGLVGESGLLSEDMNEFFFLTSVTFSVSDVS